MGVEMGLEMITFSDFRNCFTSSDKGSVKYFHTDRSKVVLLLWIICVIYVLCLSCFRICSFLPCCLLSTY